MEQESRADHWLGRYANNFHAWRKVQSNGRDAYYRPLGLIEESFDGDGLHFGGRADVTTVIAVEIRSNLTPVQFRQRVVLAWANLRLHHVLLMCSVARDAAAARCQFKLDLLKSDAEVLNNAAETITFLEDYYNEVDVDDLYKHFNNAGRIIDSDKSLSRLFVHPPKYLPGGTFMLNFSLVCAHEITDGVVVLSNWEPHFIDLLNVPEPTLLQGLEIERSPERLWSRLPQAQEDMYPLIQGSVARRRWYWAIMRILRHVRKPPPLGFVNPLRRPQRREQAMSMPQKYPEILDYSEDRKPPMNSFNVRAALSKEATLRLERLAKSVGASIGAACFALVGMAMMEIEEVRNPSVPFSKRKPFVGSFPINPRPFFGYKGPADSCMLAFSDGIWLAFLPSDLPVEGRFKLLVRQAHRQLRMYQKRLRGEKLKASFDPTDPAAIIASNYILAVERAEEKMPEHLRKGINPQGAYPSNFRLSPATCGVSSVGSIKNLLKEGKHSLDEVAAKENGLAADFRALNRTGVRARDFEFLAGCWGEDDGLRFSVSYDGNAIDEESALIWKAKMESILEPDVKSRL